MTFKQILAIDPQVLPLLQKLDQLGFDRLGDCIAAILYEDDFGTCWDMDGLDNQRILSVWKAKVLGALFNK